MIAPRLLLVRYQSALFLLLAACGAPSRAPGLAPPVLLVSDRGGSYRIYEEIDKGNARPVAFAESGSPHADTMPAPPPTGKT